MPSGHVYTDALQQLDHGEAHFLVGVEAADGEGREAALVFGEDAEELSVVVSVWKIQKRKEEKKKTYLINLLIVNHVILQRLVNPSALLGAQA